MLDCIAICRCMDKKPYGNITKSPVSAVHSANALLNRLGGGVMKRNTTINSSRSTIAGEWEQKTAVNLGFAKPSAAITRSFSVINGSTAIAGNDMGSLLPLCQVTGTG